MESLNAAAQGGVFHGRGSVRGATLPSLLGVDLACASRVLRRIWGDRYRLWPSAGSTANRFISELVGLGDMRFVADLSASYFYGGTLYTIDALH